jgi:hypothetical protein
MTLPIRTTSAIEFKSRQAGRLRSRRKRQARRLRSRSLQFAPTRGVPALLDGVPHPPVRVDDRRILSLGSPAGPRVRVRVGGSDSSREARTLPLPIPNMG